MKGKIRGSQKERQTEEETYRRTDSQKDRQIKERLTEEQTDTHKHKNRIVWYRAGILGDKQISLLKIKIIG